MWRIKLNYTFSDSSNKRKQLENPLFVLLETIHRTGSITKSAKETGFSYRHVWGSLKKWEDELGAGLIVWKKGARARLTAFGEKLLFAEQRAKARVLPLVDSLVSEMEREFALAFDETIHVISLHASHDLALNRLKDFLADEAGLYLNLHFEGSLTALGAMARGECMLAGFHVSESRAGPMAHKSLRKLLKPNRHSLIRFLTRQQGLMVDARNPKRIGAISDLKRGDVRFVNREQGSGTRLAIEQLLADEGIAPSLVNGFDRVETTHLAVAAAVACGQADAGFGIEAAAAQFNLGFVPLVREQYFFACPADQLQEPAVLKLLEMLRSPAWRGLLDDLPGYDATAAGEIVPVGALLS